MKQAKHYEKKIKTLLKGLRKHRCEADEHDPIAVMVEAAFELNATRKRAKRALDAVHEEFTDYNELRVAPPRDIVAIVGKDYPQIAERARMLVTALGRIYARQSSISAGYMGEMSKRELRRHLDELGLDEYTSAAVTLLGFGGHAIPVDQDLVDALKLDGYVHPDADIADVRGFLERIVPLKDAPAAHKLLRRYVDRSAKALAETRKKQAEAAEAARKAEEETAEAHAEKKKKRKQKRPARKKTRAKSKTTKKKRAKTTKRKTTRKTKRPEQQKKKSTKSKRKRRR